MILNVHSCSRDGLDNIHNCGRFFRIFFCCSTSWILFPLLTSKWIYSLTLKTFRQAADLCDWWCWRRADSLSLFAVGLLGFVAIFRLYSYVLLMGIPHETRKSSCFLHYFIRFQAGPTFLPSPLTRLCLSHLFPPYRWQGTSDKGRRGDYSRGKEWQRSACVKSVNCLIRTVIPVGDWAGAENTWKTEEGTDTSPHS